MSLSDLLSTAFCTKQSVFLFMSGDCTALHISAYLLCSL